VLHETMKVLFQFSNSEKIKPVEFQFFFHFFLEKNAFFKIVTLKLK